MKARRVVCVTCGEKLEVADGVQPWQAIRDAKWGSYDGKASTYRCPLCKRAVELLHDRRHVERQLADLARRVAWFERWRRRIDAELDRLDRARNGEVELPLKAVR